MLAPQSRIDTAAAPVHPVEFAATMKLQSSSYLELHQLRCSYQAGILTILGRVSSYYLLQVALSHLQKLGGVDMIENRVVVVGAAASSSI